MRCNQRALFLIIPSLLTLLIQSAVAKDVKTLEINAPAPELNLPSVDDKTYRLADFADGSQTSILPYDATNRLSNAALLPMCFTIVQIREFVTAPLRMELHIFKRIADVRLSKFIKSNLDTRTSSIRPL